MPALGLALAAALTLPVPPAHGQGLERRDTVTQRSRPDFDAVGWRVGTFTAYPSLGGELRYSDNVLADRVSEESDTAVVFTPLLRVESRGPRHRAEAGAAAELARYQDLDTEDYEDARVWLRGERELGDGIASGEVSLAEEHEDRSSPEDLAGTNELTTFNRTVVRAAYRYQPARFLVGVDLGLSTLDFDTPGSVASANLNDDRDRDVTEAGLRVGYALSPDYTVFGELRVDEIDYDQRLDRNGFARNSDSVELRAGTQIDFTGRTAGEFWLGYLDRGYDDGRFSDNSGLSFGGEVQWNITGLTTLSAGASRTIDATTIVGASGITRTDFMLGVDHELFRNLIISGELEFTNEDFEDLARDDDLAAFELAANYLLNRYLRVQAGYTYEERETSPASSGGREFEINQLFIRVTGQL